MYFLKPIRTLCTIWNLLTPQILPLMRVGRDLTGKILCCQTLCRYNTLHWALDPYTNVEAHGISFTFKNFIYILKPPRTTCIHLNLLEPQEPIVHSEATCKFLELAKKNAETF